MRNLEVPLSFEAWRLGLAPRKNTRTLISNEAFSPFLFWAAADFDSYSPNLTLYVTLVFGCLCSVLIIFYMPDLPLSNWPSSACRAFGINFSNRACGFISGQPYHSHRGCQLPVLTWCSEFLQEPWELLFSSHIALKYITLAMCFDSAEHNPLSKSAFVLGVAVACNRVTTRGR